MHHQQHRKLLMCYVFVLYNLFETSTKMYINKWLYDRAHKITRTRGCGSRVILTHICDDKSILVVPDKLRGIFMNIPDARFEVLCSKLIMIMVHHNLSVSLQIPISCLRKRHKTLAATQKSFIMNIAYSWFLDHQILVVWSLRNTHLFEWKLKVIKQVLLYGKTFVWKRILTSAL